MESLDQRTRSEADIRLVGAAEFFEAELPGLLTERGGLADRAPTIWACVP